MQVPLCLALARQATSAATARQLVTTALREWHRLARLDDALIVATELVENVFKHTTDVGELRLSYDEDSLLIEVEDSSPTLPRIIDHSALVERGGWGMRMIHHTADRWGVRNTESGGKVVWVRLADKPHHDGNPR